MRHATDPCGKIARQTANQRELETDPLLNAVAGLLGRA